MKTLRRIMAIGLLIGAYHSGFAQNNELPRLKSKLDGKEAKNQASKEEKKVEQKVDVYRVPSQPLTKQQIAERDAKIAQGKQNAKANLSTQSVNPNVRSTEKFGSEAEKIAWKEANGQNEVGSSSSEKFASDSEKQAWINANPEEYRKLTGRAETFTAAEKAALLEVDPSANTSSGRVTMKSNVKVAGVNRSTETISSEALKDAQKEAASSNK